MYLFKVVFNSGKVWEVKGYNPAHVLKSYGLARNTVKALYKIN
jgi:hypothetical protein